MVGCSCRLAAHIYAMAGCQRRGERTWRIHKRLSGRSPPGYLPASSFGSTPGNDLGTPLSQVETHCLPPLIDGVGWLTPSACAAAFSGSQPVGASVAWRLDRASSLSWIRHGAPVVSCAPRSRPASAQRTHRGPVDVEQRRCLLGGIHIRAARRGTRGPTAMP